MKATKSKGSKKPDVNVIPIACPECGCDYFMPVMKADFVKSFAGNRLQVNWPSKDGTNDTALFACPSCGVVFMVSPSGDIRKTGNLGSTKKQEGK